MHADHVLPQTDAASKPGDDGCSNTGAHRYLIALGSNLGDRSEQLASALAHIATEIGPVTAVAPVYETPPFGGAADQPFFNSAAVCVSMLAPGSVLAALLAIETAMGRVRSQHWGNRLIDLDLLLWQPRGTTTGQPTGTWAGADLVLPHPRMLERDFVLVPAADVAGDWRHPTTGQDLASLCAASGFVLGRADAPKVSP